MHLLLKDADDQLSCLGFSQKNNLLKYGYGKIRSKILDSNGDSENRDKLSAGRSEKNRPNECVYSVDIFGKKSIQLDLESSAKSLWQQTEKIGTISLKAKWTDKAFWMTQSLVHFWQFTEKLSKLRPEVFWMNQFYFRKEVDSLHGQK